ncbi:hypothetical protein P9112_005542 [Eukaryota sp. TZLM1-RC]
MMDFIMETPVKQVRVDDNDMFLQPKELFSPVESPNAVGTPALSETPAVSAYCSSTPLEGYIKTSVTLCYALFKLIIPMATQVTIAWALTPQLL